MNLFTEKAEKLLDLSFTQYLRTTGKLGIRWDADTGFERTGPAPEQIEALVLTLRFFIQDNEPTSLRRIAALYQGLPISPDIPNLANQARATWQSTLADSSWVQRASHPPLSNQEIWDTFIYGGLAHGHPAKKAVFDEWMSNDRLFLTLEMVFTTLLREFIRLIAWWRDLNARAREELAKSRGGTT